MFILRQTVMKNCDFFVILVLNFLVEKDKLELGIGQIWNQRTQILCKNNYMPNSTKKFHNTS